MDYLYITLLIELDTSEATGNIWAYVRTFSFDFDGERTDLHEVISTIFSVFLRIFHGISCSLWDIEHPASGIETELYGRYITFDQPFEHGFAFTESSLDVIKNIIFCLGFFSLRFASLIECRCPNCIKYAPDQLPKLFSYKDSEEWARNICLQTGSKDDDYQHMARYAPVWLHYRNITSNLSVAKLGVLAEYINSMFSAALNWESLTGISGDLLITDNTYNIIPSQEKARLIKAMSVLEIDKNDATVFIPMENVLVGVGKEHIVISHTFCGRHWFEEERERVRKRHQKEAELLFSPTIAKSRTIEPGQDESETHNV